MTTWTADGPPLAGGTVGGDGAGEAVSVRYTCEKPGSLTDVYWYVVDLRERNEADENDEYPWDVEEMTQFMVCTDPNDPGSTEVWSDYTYDNLSAVSYKTEADAIAERDRQVDTTAEYHWDGDPR